jgi:hypothetical protein
LQFFIGMLHTCCKGFQVFRVFLQEFQTNVSNVSSVFIRMLQMFHLDVSKADRVLHMLQWHRWLADDALPQGFGSYLAPSSRGALSSPSPPFPSLHLATVVRARQETLPDEHTNAHKGGGPGWADGGTILA